jgi:hypothetical protein
VVAAGSASAPRLVKAAPLPSRRTRVAATDRTRWRTPGHKRLRRSSGRSSNNHSRIAATGSDSANPADRPGPRRRRPGPIIKPPRRAILVLDTVKVAAVWSASARALRSTAPLVTAPRALPATARHPILRAAVTAARAAEAATSARHRVHPAADIAPLAGAVVVVLARPAAMEAAAVIRVVGTRRATAVIIIVARKHHKILPLGPVPSAGIGPFFRPVGKSQHDTWHAAQRIGN